MSHYIAMENGTSVDRSEVPVLAYATFAEQALRLLSAPERHCVAYYAFRDGDDLQFPIVIADDLSGQLLVFAHRLSSDVPQHLSSLTRHCAALHIFEREIAENFGIHFEGHPCLKPVRYPFNRHDPSLRMQDYPFYKIQGNEVHEVGVGPVHAGVIEPGHFRFSCYGEQVLNLEIQLGWQHRGLEALMVADKTLLQRNLLAENIAGDTAVGHALAFAGLMESMGGLNVSDRLQLERAIALELERIAIHTGDISALCVDVAYSLGANVFGILRTGIINFMQAWCGNRLGKSMIRVGGNYSPLTDELCEKLRGILDTYETRFMEMAHLTYRLPSVQNRFDFIGTVSEHQARLAGTVGMAARMAGVRRDVRCTHPFAGFRQLPVETEVLEKGDVFARFLLRRKEIRHSLAWIRAALNRLAQCSEDAGQPVQSLPLKPDIFAVSMTEGWRGEIAHCAVTDDKGNLHHYKIKDPSMHNWKALELSLRDLEISDFPINNKSYNLSYCGNDL